jgi:hypothetical protein
MLGLSLLDLSDNLLVSLPSALSILKNLTHLREWRFLENLIIQLRANQLPYVAMQI